MDSRSPNLAPTYGHAPTRDGLDAWSVGIRQARSRVERQLRDASALESASANVFAMDAELELSYEELSVAEEELRAQCEELASTRLTLERERARYRDLFEQAPVPYLVTDPGGVITDANIAAAQLFGPDASHLVGKPFQAFIPLAGRTRFRQALLELVGAHVVRELVFVVSPRFGEHRIVSATVNVVRDSRGQLDQVRWLLFSRGTPAEHESAVLSITKDTQTAGRVAELERTIEQRDRMLRDAEDARHEAQRAARSAVELLTTVSHELRTPLSALVGYAEMLSIGIHGPLTSAQTSDVERMSGTLDHIVGLIDNLLLYFRAGVGALPVELDDVFIRPAVEKVVALVQPILSPKRLQIVVAPPDLNVVVRADGDRFRQILINLVANAVKYSSEDGVIVVSWQVYDAYAVVDVRDEGVGIPTELIDQIFEPFVQLDHQANNGAAGFGLGLAISRRLARAMGGELAARSASGSGSTFSLRLPRVR